MSLTFVEQAEITLIGIGATGIVAGLLVPLVKALMDNRYFQKQKEFEKQIKLQENILDKKIKFFDDLTAAYWNFYFCCVKFTYYAPYDSDHSGKKAFEEYSDVAWKAISEARRLSSPGSYLLSEHDFHETVGKFLKKIEDVDLEISDAQENAKRVDWEKLHDKIQEGFAHHINVVTSKLANVLGISLQHLDSSRSAE